MKVILRPHLKIRLKQRKIPQNYPTKVVNSPEYKYFDTETNHLIAIKKLEYNGKSRPMAVSYDIMEDILQIITIHPVSEQEIQNKLRRGRWIKNEED